jgi:thymidylate kinase
MESKGEDFHGLVRRGYKKLIEQGGEYRAVDARGKPDEVFANIAEVLRSAFAMK